MFGKPGLEENGWAALPPGYFRSETPVELSWFSTFAQEERDAGSSTPVRFAQNDSKDGSSGVLLERRFKGGFLESGSRSSCVFKVFETRGLMRAAGVS